MASDEYNPIPRRFSRRWWLDKCQTPLWVAAVTILIWVYADMELKQTQEVNVIIDLQTGPNMALLLGNREIHLPLKVQGNSNGIDRFKRMLKARGDRLPVDISDLTTGRHRMSVDDLLARNDEFQRSGLSVVSDNTMDQRFELDSVVTHTVEVQFRYTGAELLTEETIDPPKVDVRCPKGRWAEIVEKAKPNAPVIRTREINLREFAPGKEHSTKVPLLPQIGGVDVDINGQTTVTVTFQIERVTSSREITLNVWLLIPRIWAEDDTWKEYRFEKFNQVEWQPKVNVTGSPEALEQLLSRGNEIEAFIRLTDDDKSRVDSWITRTVIVRFPSDLNVELEGESPKVMFKLAKR
ncbi:MAG: hypothetical protein FWE88_00410 [Phycisphaerae bacterium]|nr:hypothetical protein [Phycisphaerae bacterium]